MDSADMDTSGFVTSWSADNPPYVILKWSIRQLLLAGKVLKSPCFDVSRTSRWNLLLEPRIVVDGDVFVGVHLRRHPGCEPPTARSFLKGEMSVHGPQNELLFDKIFEEVYDPQLNDGVEFRIAKVFLPKHSDEEAEYLVRCEMVVSHEINEANDDAGTRLHLEKLSHDLKRLYNEGTHTDATIGTLGGSVIRVHKAILRARSPLFARTLKEGSNDPRTLFPDHIRVPDESPYVASLLLFVYCGNPDWMFASVPLEMFGVLATIARKWELDELVNVLTPLKMHCRTSMRTENFKYTWDIKNLSGCENTMHSTEFFLREETSSTRWRLRIERTAGTYGLYLVKVNSDRTTHSAEVEFRVLNCRTKDELCKRLDHKFGRSGDQKCGISTFFTSRFFHHPTTTRDDPVQVTCTLKILLDTESWIQYKGTSIDVSDRDRFSLKYLKILSTHLRRLHEDPTDCDFSLLCADHETLKAHRAILWARCPAFREMPASNSAQLPCDATTLRDVLAYIYTAELPTFSCSANAQKLYALSSLLKLELLLGACQSFLARHLSVDNVLEVLVLAHEHGDRELEKAAEAFVCVPGNARQIIATSRWRQFCNKHIKLALPIYHNLAWAYCSRC